MMEVSEKVSIVNALIAEDRNEIRKNKEIILRSSYFIISGVIAIGAFSMTQSNDRFDFALLCGIWSLFTLYFVCFAFLMNHLIELRIILEARERYYKNLELFDNKNPFNPLQGPTDESRRKTRIHRFWSFFVNPVQGRSRFGKPELYTHGFFWFFPLMSFGVAVFNSVIVLYVS